MAAQRIAVMLFPKGRAAGSGVTISAFTIRARRFEIPPRCPCDPEYRNYDMRGESAETVLTTRRLAAFYAWRTMGSNTPCTDLQRSQGMEGNRWRSIPTHCLSSAGNQTWSRPRRDYSP